MKEMGKKRRIANRLRKSDGGLLRIKTALVNFIGRTFKRMARKAKTIFRGNNKGGVRR